MAAGALIAKFRAESGPRDPVLAWYSSADPDTITYVGHTPKTPASLHELRSRIERGRYQVKPDRVAEAMLRRGIKFGSRRPAARRD
jgi:hypothetical protein